MMARSALLALAAVLFTPLVGAVQELAISGSNFITNTTGDRFYIIGADYQPGGSSAFTSTADPLSDATTCLRDAILLQNLGVNTVRVYNLDTDLDHNACVSIFAAAGIYLLLDVNSGTYGQYIDRTDPASTYTLAYLEHVFGIIEAFAPFPNILGFFAGNEIINEDSSADAPLYIRAVVRDMKQYIANNIDKDIGVGYSAADVSTLLSDTYNYLACTLSNDTYSNIDFFGLNDYEWCGDSSYTVSGYDDLAAMFADTAIPVFFSEYGCNNVSPRTFTNVPVLYGSEMSVLSGGLVYEYSQETNDYGLVTINSSTELTLISDYNYLAAELLKVDWTSLTAVNTTAEAQTPVTCAASIVTSANFTSINWDLPSAPSGAAAVIASGLSSPNKGGLVTFNSNNDTAEAATVYNTTGAEITGLKLTILDDDDSNYPGLIAAGYTASAGAGVAAATTTAGSASSSSTAGAAPTNLALQGQAVAAGAVVLGLLLA